jgi:multimeric flavodoxin WrbA
LLGLNAWPGEYATGRTDLKILAISGSPRERGNTVTLLDQVLAGAKEGGAEIELFSVAGKDIRPCDGCWACTRTGKCHVDDDMGALRDKMTEADGIIFGTPIYFYDVTAQMKAVMDRSIGLKLANKVGSVVAVCGSLGLVDALKDFAFFMMSRRMFAAGHVSAYASNPDELRKMEKCMKAAHDMGRLMAAMSRAGFKYPEEFASTSAIAYGTHTR